MKVSEQRICNGIRSWTLSVALILAVSNDTFSQAGGASGEGETGIHNKENFQIKNTPPDGAPASGQSLYNFYGNFPGSHQLRLTFSLENKSDVTCELLDTAGKRMVRDEWKGVKDDTFRLSYNELSGIYLLRLQIGNQVYTERVILMN